MKNITLRAFICTFILGLLGNSSTFAQEDYGDLCGETIDILFEQSENPFAVVPSNSTTLGAGQSFQTDAAYEIGGIFINARIQISDLLTSKTFNLNLYEGQLSNPIQPLGTPIATSSIILPGDSDNVGRIFFEFPDPVNLTASTDYYFLVDPVVEVDFLPGFTRLLQVGFQSSNSNPITSGGFITQISEGVFDPNNEDTDLSFGFYTCPPCTKIIDITVLNESACNDNDATFSLSFDVADGSGNYNIVATEANEELGVTANQVLGSITDGDTDADDLQIMGSIPNTTESGSISVVIVDADNLMCTMSLGIPVTIEACPPSEPLPAMNRWGLILFSMMILSAGLLAYRRF